ncbi:hypothetical protein ACLOJK_033725 [Asimina triloba]
MIRASVLQHTELFIEKEKPKQIPQLKQKEHECFFAVQQCKNMDEFKQFHAQTLKLGLTQDAFMIRSFISACALSAWGSMDYARLIFDQIDKPETFDFNTMIRGYINNNNPIEAILLYKEMQEMEVKPDEFTYPPLLKGCALVSALQEGMQIHGHVFKFGFQSNLFAQNSLINMYGKCAEIDLSRWLFDQMESKSVASWSALIAAYNRIDMWDECLRLFEMMSREGWRADESTLVSVLCSCAHLGVFDLGRSIHGCLIRSFLGHNIIAATALINMYAKCGRLEKALCIFRSMPSKNIVTYSAMISGLALHGEGKTALSLFSDMMAKGIRPNDGVYVGVLSACSHAGLIEEGLRCFDRMRFEHRIAPTIQHYGCMVDLLGRSGKLDEAYELIRSMPMAPNDVVWRCLLCACKVHNNMELAESASRHLLELEPPNVGDYTLLANIYAQNQRWEAVARVRVDMVSKGIAQTPGFSMVEVKGKLHKFVSQDMSHPRSHEVYEMLHQIGWQLKFDGYSPDTSQVLFDVDEEEKQRLLLGHSQKLAVAFALISTAQGSPIRVVRNLRMCSDCHKVTKMISKIFKREISVRDRNRFHHFRDGRCSCGDYW